MSADSFQKYPDSGQDSSQDETLLSADAFSILEVIDRLEVGPLKIESDRIVAPYRVVQGDSDEVIELVYDYEEKVFDPEEPDSQNLAHMIACQLALNYGLFCRRIVFHGLYDTTDQRFIRIMLENIARETYVKKFLEHNPYLIDEVSEIRAVKKDRYLQAELVFPDWPSESMQYQWKSWPVEKEKHAILSNGGMYSLLSYGLISEIGQQAHPIFFHESRGSLDNALNAYNYFNAHIPPVSRISVNAEEVFTWMHNHFPFIRPESANLIADEYSIRLWTVPIFLFGALPVLKQRGIERLLIGDEFDTSRRASFQGITHYDGLYERSIYFDNALTRYFMKKKWGIVQFSILRPLSRILIEKILYERYPELQVRQVSCQAPEAKGDRTYPCGTCEKCRQVVSMLLAIGGDPSRCGYSQAQVERILQEIPHRLSPQASAGARQLYLMLAEKGIAREDTGKKPEGAPEILKMRFDNDRSPLNSVPVDLREPLYRIYLAHSNGAVRRSGRMWIDFPLFSDPAITEPYPFEGKGWKKTSSKSLDYSCVLGDLTWPEAQKRFKEVDVALLPVGAIEQHGPHLPLDTDAFDADYLVRQVAAHCSDPKPIVLPLIPYGVSYHHADFSGTMGINPDSLSRIVYDIGLSAARNGITKLLIINGHGGNTPALNFAAQMINRDARILVTVDSGETSDADISEITETPNDVHSGEIETSTALAVRPQLVKMDNAQKMVPQFSSRYMNFTSKCGVSWYARTRKISTSGVLGDPTRASAEKGRRIWEITIAHLVEFIEDIKGMTLDEIYEKQY